MDEKKLLEQIKATNPHCTLGTDGSLEMVALREARRSAKLGKMGKKANEVWGLLPPGTKLPPGVENLLRELIKS